MWVFLSSKAELLDCSTALNKMAVPNPLSDDFGEKGLFFTTMFDIALYISLKISFVKL